MGGDAMGLANRIAGAAAIVIGLSAPPAQAGYVVDLTQEGGNVVATGSGAIDLTGLSFLVPFLASARISPIIGIILTGPVVPFILTFDAYTGITGPASFGSGGENFPSSGGGDAVGVVGSGLPAILVPAGYVSESPLSST